jgi:hypothetical protein
MVKLCVKLCEHLLNRYRGSSKLRAFNEEAHDGIITKSTRVEIRFTKDLTTIGMTRPSRTAWLFHVLVALRLCLVKPNTKSEGNLLLQLSCFDLAIKSLSTMSRWAFSLRLKCELWSYGVWELNYLEVELCDMMVTCVPCNWWLATWKRLYVALCSMGNVYGGQLTRDLKF